MASSYQADEVTTDKDDIFGCIGIGIPKIFVDPVTMSDPRAIPMSSSTLSRTSTTSKIAKAALQPRALKPLTRPGDDGTLEIDLSAAERVETSSMLRRAKSTENHDEYVPQLPRK